MMDNIDLQIMKEFTEIVGQPVRKIGSHLDISYNRVDKRIKRMKEQQIIDKFITIVNHRFLAIKKHIY